MNTGFRSSPAPHAGLGRLVWITWTLCTLFATGTLNAQPVDIITIKHRSAEEVLAVVKPLVEPAGSVSALGDQLIVRTAAANLVQVRKMIEAADRVPRRLLISVRQVRGGEGAGQGTGSGARVRTYSTRQVEGDRAAQQVQVVEGARAFIRTGESVPVRGRTVTAVPGGVAAGGLIVADAVQFRDLTTGFYVSPRVAGDTVTLEVSTRQDTPAGKGTGSAEVQNLTMTVSGPLGSWIELGGTGREDERDAGPGAARSYRATADARRIYLKAEDIR
jgi:hypothetical protein